MKCPRCDGSVVLVDTERGVHGTLRRRYHCVAMHRFTTVEVYEPQGTTIERVQLMNALRGIASSIATVRRPRTN
jgi:transcriptional regulator NrdR family protein